MIRNLFEAVSLLKAAPKNITDFLNYDTVKLLQWKGTNRLPR